MPQTARLDLAPMADDALDDLTGMLSNPEVMRFYPAVGDRPLAQAVIAAIKSGTPGADDGRGRRRESSVLTSVISAASI